MPSRGHEVTVFHRGRTGGDLFRGDAGSSCAPATATATCPRWPPALGRHRGHLCLLPRQVQALADVLGDRGGRYLLVSSVSAYAAPPHAGYGEDSPLAELDDPTPRRSPADVRRPQGAVRARGGRALRQDDDDRPAHLRHRPGRLHVALPLVGGPDGPRRRGPGAGTGRRPRPGDRRAGHGVVDGRPSRAGGVGRLPRGEPRRRRSPGASSWRPSATRSRPPARR